MTKSPLAGLNLEQITTGNGNQVAEEAAELLNRDPEQERLERMRQELAAAGYKITKRSSTDRNREWDKDNRPHSYRVGNDVHEALHAIKEDVMQDGDFRTTVDIIADTVMRAGLDAWEQGTLEIPGWEIQPKPRGRRRNP